MVGTHVRLKYDQRASARRRSSCTQRYEQSHHACATDPLTRVIAIVVISLTVVCPMILGAQSPTSEYRLKAAFLFHFAEFVDWPTEVIGNDEDSFCICVLGEDPFQGDLEATVQGKLIAARAVSVRHVKEVQEAQGCQILFVGKNEL